LCFRC
jgi:hypothetical protein